MTAVRRLPDMPMQALAAARQLSAGGLRVMLIDAASGEGIPVDGFDPAMPGRADLLAGNCVFLATLSPAIRNRVSRSCPSAPAAPTR